MSEGENQQFMQRKVIPVRKAALSQTAVASGLFLLLWLMIALAALSVGGLSHLLILPIALAMVVVFGALTWWTIRRRGNEEPALIIDEVGIYDNVSIAHAGRTKWRDLDRVWLAGPSWMRLLCLRPDNVLAFMDEQEDSRRWLMHLQNGIFGAPIVIPLHVVDLPSEDVWHRIIEIAGPKHQPAEASSTPLAGA